MWCATQLVTDAEQTADSTIRAYQRARAKLCAGDAAAARAGFAAILPQMKTRYRNDGLRFIDFARSYFYALLASGQADEARRFLTDAEQGWTPASAERLFWKGDYAGSFAAYVADDGSVQRSPDEQAAHELDPHVAAAAEALRAGKPGAAVADMRAVSDGASLYVLMLGNLYAQRRDWPNAFRTWVTAADAGPSQPALEFYVLDRWNISALEMLYYYRVHAPH